MPRHYHSIAQSEQLTGKFNSHLEKTILLHVQEAFWAGSHSAESVLKYLITSEKIMIEPKGLNAFSVDSYLRIFVSANSDWVVPTSFDERRFCVLDVGEKRLRDTVYFAAVRKEMLDDCGLSGLLHHLQSIDLTGFDVRNPPKTAGLTGQHVQSLRGIDGFLFDLVATGIAPGDVAFDDLDNSWGDGPTFVSTTDLHRNYHQWRKDDPHRGQAMTSAVFGKSIMQAAIKVSKHHKRVGGKPRWFYQIPSLQDCRDTFDAQLGTPWNWDVAPPEDGNNEDLLG